MDKNRTCVFPSRINKGRAGKKRKRLGYLQKCTAELWDSLNGKHICNDCRWYYFSNRKTRTCCRTYCKTSWPRTKNVFLYPVNLNYFCRLLSFSPLFPILFNFFKHLAKHLVQVLFCIRLRVCLLLKLLYFTWLFLIYFPFYRTLLVLFSLACVNIPKKIVSTENKAYLCPWKRILV